MREAAAAAAVFLRDHGAEQARLPGLGPDLARVHVIVVPLFEMRSVFGRDEAARLLFKQHEVFGHPGWARAC